MDLALQSSGVPLRVSLIPTQGDGFEAKYRRHVLDVRESGVVADEVFIFDPVLVMNNIKRGTRSLRPHLGALRADASIDWDAALAADDVAEALVYACGLTGDVKVTREQIDEVRRNLQKLREPALHIARGLGLLGELPLARVEQIEEGAGLVDMGQDGLALAALYREFAPTIAGKHPFDDKRLQKLEALGAWILRNVTPSGAEAVAPVEPTEAARNRDLLWAELKRRHRDLRLGGFRVFGEEFNDHVPVLRSRPSSPRKAAGDEVVEETPATPAAPNPPSPAPV